MWILADTVCAWYWLSLGDRRRLDLALGRGHSYGESSAAPISVFSFDYIRSRASPGQAYKAHCEGAFRTGEQGGFEEIFRLCRTKNVGPAPKSCVNSEFPPRRGGRHAGDPSLHLSETDARTEGGTQGTATAPASGRGCCQDTVLKLVPKRGKDLPGSAGWG